MSPKDRALAALTLRQPDDIVPTFELEFQLGQEFFGRDFVDFSGLTGDDRERAIGQNVDLHLLIAETFDYSIIRTSHVDELLGLVAQGADRRYLLCGEADGTMSIPDGDTMMDLATDLMERPEHVHGWLRVNADQAIERGHRQMDAGAECLTMCSDYCFNRGPFLSPRQFAEFVTPYLAEHIRAFRDAGAVVIKHTDGDLMPILDQLVDAGPHALHSLDPQGRVDIAAIKAQYGHRLALCGNVNCAWMQTETDAMVDASALYALRFGMPGGGYIFCTSNVAFKGMPPERYQRIMDLRKEFGRYDRPVPIRPEQWSAAAPATTPV